MEDFSRKVFIFKKHVFFGHDNQIHMKETNVSLEKFPHVVVLDGAE